MAGHNKWSSIKHKKAKTDAQKGKLFSKLAREITMAAKLGGSDPEMNPRLRLAIQNAKEGNMPNENVKRAIQKGDGSLAGDDLEEIVFEAYGPSGVALLVSTLTDNRTRTVANVKYILSKHAGSMASKGAVSYMFQKKGVFIFGDTQSQDELIDIAMQYEVDELDQKDDGTLEVVCSVDVFSELRSSFEDAEIQPQEALVSMIADTMVTPEKEAIKKNLALIDALEEDDDVQSVDANMNIPDELFNEYV